jgi:hypothetical protein
MTTKLLKFIESYSDGRSVVEDYIDQRTADADTAVIVGDEPQLCGICS